MSDNNGKNNAELPAAIGCGIICLLTIVFVILKLCRILTWSWLWIFSPLWLSVALLFVFVIVVFIAGFIMR